MAPPRKVSIKDHKETLQQAKESCSTARVYAALMHRYPELDHRKLLDLMRRTVKPKLQPLGWQKNLEPDADPT